MATATIYVGPGDGYVRKYGGAWSGLVTTGSVTGNDAYPTATADYCCVCENTNPMNGRGFFPFDFSDANIPVGAHITAVTLSVYVTAKGSAGGGTSANNSVSVVKGTPASNTTLATTDFGNVGSTEWVTSRTQFSAFTTSAYNSFTLNASAITEAQSKADSNGYFVCALRGGYDLDNVAPTGNSNIQTKFQENGSLHAYVTVTYTPAVAVSTSDAWAWRDTADPSTRPSGGTITHKRTTPDAWAWSDSAAPYWRAQRSPVLVRAEGANTALNGAQATNGASITVTSTSGFPSSGQVQVINASNSAQQVTLTYTGTTATTFTGLSGGSATSYATASIVCALDATTYFPQVTALGTGERPSILVSYTAKPGHSGLKGTIKAKRSAKGGVDFASLPEITLQSAPVVSGRGIFGHVIARLKNGRLLLMWYEHDMTSMEVYSYMKYSDDDGDTWSSPTALSVPSGYAANTVAVGFDTWLDTSGSANATYGDLYVTCYAPAGLPWGTYAAFSKLMKITDGGATDWTFVSTIATVAQTSSVQNGEASITQLPDGTFASLMRVETAQRDRYIAYASTIGGTWTGHAKIVDYLGNAAVAHVMPEGHVVTQGQELRGAGGGVYGSTVTYVSLNSAVTWPSTLWRQEENDATYSIGVGSDFATLADTSVSGRRVLNVYSQERANQAGAQTKFQWYALPNFPLVYDTWEWSDSAAGRITASFKTATDAWAWTDTNTRVVTTIQPRTTSDTWAWTDTALANSGGTFARSASDTWTWTDSVSRSVSSGPAPRTTADAWAWTDALTRTSTQSRSTADFWLWTEPAATSAAPRFWLLARRRTMSAPSKTYVQVLPKGTTRTTSYTSPTYEAKTEAGILVVLDVTSASGTGGLTLRINAHDQASSQAIPLNAAPTAVTTAGTTSYSLYPFSAVAGNVTQATSFYLPRLFSITVTAGDTSSYTYSIGYCLLP